MKINELEELYLRSLDQKLNAAEQSALDAAMRAYPEFAADAAKYKSMREVVRRTEDATFGPYFAQKVIQKLQTVKIGIDRQIMIFFKRYQLAAFGLMILLVTVNVLSAEKLDFASILGYEENVIQETPTTPDEDDLLSFDLYENLNNN
jgi:hypothetical protein